MAERIKVADKITKQWVMAVRRGWLSLLSPKIETYPDAILAAEALKRFVVNLREQVYFVTRGPGTGAVFGENREKIEKEFQSVLKDMDNLRSTVRHWAESYEGKYDRHDPEARSKGEYMLNFYREKFKEAVEGWQDKANRSKSNPMGNPKRIEGEKLLDKILKLLYDDVRKREEISETNQKFQIEDEVFTDRSVFKEFDLYGMKVIVNDSTLSGGQVEEYIKYLDEAYQRMKAKGFADMWYGNVYIECKECGGVNQYGKDLGVAGHYNIHKNHVKIFDRPGSFIVRLMGHELAHRYWFKNMSSGQRAHFIDLIENGGIPAVSEYGKVDPSEAFAEVVSYIVVGRDITRDQIDSLKAVLRGKGSRLARRYLASIVRLDLPWVEKMRKDFLTLMKNVDRVTNYRDFDVFRTGMKVYSKRFKELFFDDFLNKETDAAKGQSYSDPMGASSHWIHYANNKLRSPAWTFYIDTSSIPGGYPDQYNSEERIVARFQLEGKKWRDRTMRNARTFWTALKEFLEVMGTSRPDQPIEVSQPEAYNTTLEGFKVIVRGFKNTDFHNEALEKFKEGIRVYRKRAAQVLPVLISKQLPVILEFKPELEKGGTYNHNGTITLYASSLMSADPLTAAKILAHEMGHHLWHSVLPGDAKTLWESTVKGDYGPIDLEDLLSKWPDGAWAFDMPTYLKSTDPILGLQVAAYAQSYPNLQTKEEYEGLREKGQKELIVPMTPITGYANKNPEEAFCEAVGMLVAYGPRTLHDRVKLWLEVVTGSDITSKMASTNFPLNQGK